MTDADALNFRSTEENDAKAEIGYNGSQLLALLQTLQFLQKVKFNSRLVAPGDTLTPAVAVSGSLV